MLNGWSSEQVLSSGLPLLVLHLLGAPRVLCAASPPSNLKEGAVPAQPSLQGRLFRLREVSDGARWPRQPEGEPGLEALSCPRPAWSPGPHRKIGAPHWGAPGQHGRACLKLKGYWDP